MTAADLNVQDVIGSTTLHMFVNCIDRDYCVIQKLLSRVCDDGSPYDGVDLYLENERGLTAEQLLNSNEPYVFKNEYNRVKRLFVETNVRLATYRRDLPIILGRVMTPTGFHIRELYDIIVSYILKFL